MTAVITPELYPDLVEIAAQPGFGDWLAMVKATGGCADPIHLWGQSRTIYAATGEVLAQRDPGRLLLACGNRRRSRCPSCSETYRADTYQLIKAGLVGGKDVPLSVAGHPKVFATFTAPSFGPVHQRILSRHGQPRRCHPHGPHRCAQRHRPDDPQIGQPLDPDSYDYTAAVIWNALATRLWARTVQLVNRKAAHLLGVAQRDWPVAGRVVVAKVAEYQARGLVHFHAIFRLDGPQPDKWPPPGATAELLCDAIRQAAKTVSLAPPASPALPELAPVVWGEQLDLKPITERQGGESPTEGEVAGYIAKYATKGAEATGTIDRPLACRRCHGAGHIENETNTAICEPCGGTGLRRRHHEPNITNHAKAMIGTCWHLGARAELAHLRLRPWAHMLGFRGHFSTKSRGYSTTLGCLREARRSWRDQRTLAAYGLPFSATVARIPNLQSDDLEDTLDSASDTVLVIGDWWYTGRGHAPAESIYASTIADDLANSRRIGRQVERDFRDQPD